MAKGLDCHQNKNEKIKIFTYQAYAVCSKEELNKNHIYTKTGNSHVNNIISCLSIELD